ncbi:response regulator transcription factor [Limnohabitans sp. T6-5]|uniref:response regulator transcription factor n=1 Tax=Limnohabitans sp. T6-5 TaxID=1100724 RepID=UPI001E38DC1D|nr:response regulator transcription factor [Limnohabitans sp. T6-5]
MCIDIVLADPYPVMLDGLSHVFGASPDFSVKSCVKNGDDALHALLHHQPHILVMDLSLTQRSGLSLLEEIKGQNLRARPIVFTGAPVGEVMRAIDMDIPGLVSKEKASHVLTRCIKSVHEGGKWLDRDLTVKTMSLLLEQQKKNGQASHLLTPREMMVARMVTEGWPNKKIASKLFISEGTAKLHLHHIYQKLNCPGRMSLQRYMQEHGLV